jgi:aminomethyltransferase
MPIPSPFHPRTSKLCTSLFYKDWSGYHAVRSYDTYMEREYFAFRHAAGMIDVTPLFKYEVHGPDATDFLCRVMVRNIKKLKLGQVAYSCWCDDDGKMVDDGTVSRLDETYFRVTSNAPALSWFLRHARGFSVTIEDSTQTVAALSLQGPKAREILQQISDAPLETMRFFRLARARVDGVEAVISRTGYTGDLGYEIWVPNRDAVPLWDGVMAAGKPFGIQPAGLDAMDVTRLEAGFILNGVDYFSTQHCYIESRKSTPFEMALGWMVHLDREPFNGQAALAAEKKAGPRRLLVGLAVDWDDYERLFARHGLPPEVPPGAWRSPVPVYSSRGKQVGQATSGAWSPILKTNLALATVRADYGAIGTELMMEITVEYERRRAAARVVKKPFFDPERKKA